MRADQTSIKNMRNGAKMANKKAKPFNYLTVASVLSAIAVVIIHSNSFYSFAESPRWIFANFINTFFTFAVPVFFMISGATLIDYRDRYDTKTFLKKRFKKTLIPFIFWSLAAVAMHFFWLKDLPADNYSALNLINGILSCTFLPIFWFFAPLFALYLAIPVLSAIDKKIRQNVFRYIIAGSLILNFVIPSALRAFHIPLSMSVNFALTAQSAIYYAVVGYYIHNYKLSKRTRVAIYSLGALAIFGSFIGTTVLSFRANSIVGFLTDIADSTYAFYGPAIFLIIKTLFEKKRRSAKSISARIFTFLGNFTFASYLTHWFPLAFISVYVGNSHAQWWYPLIAVPLCLVFAIITKTVFSKIPLLRHVLPD